MKLFLILILQLACIATSQEVCKDTNQQTHKIKRQLLPKSDFVLKSPTDYLKRERKNAKTGKIIEYDPRPQIVPVDVKAGKYHLRWIGYDGKVKIVEYQRPDAIDAVISASTSKDSEGQYVYDYSIQIRHTSPAHLSDFFVQTFVESAKPINVGGSSVGKVGNFITYFSNGNWLGFAYSNKEATPGREGRAQILSNSPPGLVECRISGGERTLKGAGEHMPYELERCFGGYEEWPKGYTIGPIDKLTTMTKEERAKYLSDLLSKFQEIGWMTSEVKPCYQAMLMRNDLAGALKRAEQDLKAERITSEVYSIIEGLNQQ